MRHDLKHYFWKRSNLSMTALYNLGIIHVVTLRSNLSSISANKSFTLILPMSYFHFILSFSMLYFMLLYMKKVFNLCVCEFFKIFCDKTSYTTLHCSLDMQVLLYNNVSMVTTLLSAITSKMKSWLCVLVYR